MGHRWARVESIEPQLQPWIRLRWGPVEAHFYWLRRVRVLGCARAGTRLPFVQYVASLAVLQAVQEAAASRLGGAAIDMRIKWPNDLYISGLKV